MGIYVGHAVDSNAYKCYIPRINDFMYTEDIRFQEHATDVFEAQKTPDESETLWDRKMEKTIERDSDFM